ncbi:MAG TPA: histidine phosphatase family protein [Acidimicrobiales bacterium]
MLIIVRHGQTQANASGLLLGHADPPLDATGREQASAVRSTLGPLAEGTRVLASPLLRAQETAAIVAGDVPVEVDDRWIELDYGGFDGKPIHDVPTETWARWRSDPTFAPEGGETLQSLGVRVAAACDSLLAEIPERDIVVVTHVSPVKASVAWALGVGDEVAWRTFVAPGSITRVGARAGVPVLLSFNETPVHAP